MRKQRKGEIGYILKLFISGATTNSTRAITNLQKILETYLQGKYILNIIDVRQETSVAKQEQIIALPLLIVKKPLPERRLIGDMSNTKKVLKGLGITSSEDEE
jgi:circadian clock protein KaiB